MILTIVTIAFNIFLFCTLLFTLATSKNKTAKISGIILMINLALNSYMVLQAFRIAINA